MDFPLQLKFFKKLDHFQTLIKLDKQFNHMLKKSIRVKPTWELEKKILRWVYLGHKHLGTPLDPERFDKNRAKNDKKVKGDIKDIGATLEEFSNGRNIYSLQNLVIRGYATLANKRSYHLYKQGREDLTVEKGVYDGIMGESKKGGAPQDIKGGIYLTESGLIMAELIAEISYFKNISTSDPYNRYYNATQKLSYYKTMFWHFELLVFTAWCLIFTSLILISGQAIQIVGKPKIFMQFIPFELKTLIRYLIILPPILLIMSIFLRASNFIEKSYYWAINYLYKLKQKIILFIKHKINNFKQNLNKLLKSFSRKKM